MHLLEHLDKLQTTPLGALRIKRNLSLDTEDVVSWCRTKILDKAAVIDRVGKNWYVTTDGCRITVNANSNTIITAHKLNGTSHPGPEAVQDAASGRPEPPRKVVLFLAVSLDGYIADTDGGVAWLQGQDQAEKTPDTYASFIKNVDTVLMGWNTYHQIVTELSPERWPYAGLTCYVVTHRSPPENPDVRFTARGPEDLLRELRQQSGKHIWLCGGADLVQQCVRENLIDEYDLSVIPTILGGGVRLFGNAPQEIPLQLARTQSCNGIADLVYVRR